jgi:hypothetical protein
MTDIPYLCRNCGGVYEVESIRQNLMLDLLTTAPVADRPLPCRQPTGGTDAGAAPEHRARRAPPRLARLLLTLLVIRGPRRSVTRILHGSALRCQR